MEHVVLYASASTGADRPLAALAGGSTRVQSASTVASVREAVAADAVDVVVVDDRFDGEGSGLDAVSAVRGRDASVPVVFRSHESDGELAAAATRAGATEYYPADATAASLADRVRAHLRIDGGEPVAERDGSVADRGGSVAERDGPRANERGSAVGEGGSMTDEGDGNGGGAVPNGGVERGTSDDPATPGPGTSTVDAERYGQILEAVDDGVYAVDRAARFVYVNEAMERLTGYDRSDLLGEHVETITNEAAMAEAARLVEEMRRGTATRKTVAFELERADGETVPCEDHLTLLTDEDGAFDGTAGVIRDVTDRRRRDRRLSNLLETSRSLLEARSPRDVAAVVATATEETLGRELSVVRLVDEESGRLVPVARAGDSPAVTDRPAYAVGEGGPGTAFERGEILRYDGDEVGEAVGDIGRAEDALYVPLGDRGVLTVVTTEPEGFSDDAVSTAEVLASTAAVALDRASREEELLRYRTVIENVHDMVYVLDGNHRFTLVTEPLADWLGYDREELVGVHPELVMADGEVETFESAVADLWRGGDDDASRRVETELVSADGDRRPAEVEVSLYPADDEFAGTVGVVRDLSELVRTRQLLEDQRDRFSYLFDNLPDAVVESEHDADGRPVVREVNEAFTDVFGYGAEEVVGELLNDFVLPDDVRDEGERLDREAVTGEITNEEVRRRTDRGYRDFLFRGIPYERTDAGARSFGIYTDITAQKERERRLEVLNRVLRHNLRNDVNVLVGYAEMLVENATDGTQRSRAEAVHEKATELAALSDRARSLDRTMRRGSPRDSTVALGSLVDDVREAYATDNPSLAVETDVEDVRVVGDDRLGLALRELFDNVVEHVGDDATVRVETERSDRELRLRLLDDGPGVPADERAVLTGAVEITQLRHGSGLGLWVVKWVCESCGGRLDFDVGPDGNAVVLSLTPADGY